MPLLEIYEQIVTGKQVALKDYIDFIMEVSKTLGDPKTESSIQQVFQAGLGQNVVNQYVTLFEKNPDLFKTQIYYLIAKTGNIIKIYHKNLEKYGN